MHVVQHPSSVVHRRSLHAAVVTKVIPLSPFLRYYGRNKRARNASIRALRRNKP
jgi:hypothetical protein